MYGWISPGIRARCHAGDRRERGIRLGAASPVAIGLLDPIAIGLLHPITIGLLEPNGYPALA
ncbi:hypothetical protein [Natronorubrum daqingense]|uniref:Uncharacterized protein n=1 Tax=Natronorubrum daqingense TaxID=588898 RepID=A0A1N7C832_9EURY|nr:hypothetical protein [Natronorubrum daqingense]APX96785.1 hypothetical protein BB347_09220 [Natronorubrum daqingense]SIR59745.1 hypothetical protein SAMN05421809_1566 [Natronorubrum daqingense]